MPTLRNAGRRLFTSLRYGSSTRNTKPCHFRTTRKFWPSWKLGKTQRNNVKYYQIIRSFADDLAKALLGPIKSTNDTQSKPVPIAAFEAQGAHLTRKTLISFADLPRFLTMEVNIRVAAIPALAHTLDALKSGFATIIQPLVDYEFQQHKKLQLNLLFTLPEISSSKSLCTVEQLQSITY